MFIAFEFPDTVYLFSSSSPLHLPLELLARAVRSHEDMQTHYQAALMAAKCYFIGWNVLNCIAPGSRPELLCFETNETENITEQPLREPGPAAENGYWDAQL